MARLSEAQIHALGALSDGKLDEVGAMVAAGRSHARTFAALDRAGFAVWQPYAGRGRGAWAITPAGRAEVDRLLTAGRLVREDA